MNAEAATEFEEHVRGIYDQQARIAITPTSVRFYDLACQQRTGSAFGMQARWPTEQIGVTGRSTEFVRMSDAGEERTFRFCPECGTTLFWTTEDWTGTIAVAIGAFTDPSFPPPTVSIWEARRYPWLPLPEQIEHHD
jgi:hypothetical protein